MNSIGINWITPVTDYPNITHGKVRIKHEKKSTKDLYYNEGVRGYWFVKYKPAGNKITVLEIDDVVWMTDEPAYTWSLQYFAEKSYGKVLVAGLGLGIVVHFLVNNVLVKDITVVEREKDVIEAVSKLLPADKRINIVQGDFYVFMQQDKKKRNTLIWDLGLWNNAEERKVGLQELLIMPRLTLRYYGKDCTLFRHGMDRDPAGEELIRNNPEMTYRYLKAGE